MQRKREKGGLRLDFLTLKTQAAALAGMAAAACSALFGPWNAAMATLMIFMLADYVSGVVSAALFHNSDKSENGALSSKAGWQGLCKKAMMLLCVLVAWRLDLLSGSGGLIKDGIILALTLNEAVSILENAGRMGVPVPEPLRQAVDLLGKKSGSK